VLKDVVNRGLRRATGYELRRADGSGTAGRRRYDLNAERLLDRPAFILSSVRSGSTLLRVLLNSHPELHAPHETHLRDIDVTLKESKYIDRALESSAIEGREGLRFLLWDRYLQRELATSGKPRLVNKTPNDVFIVDEIKRCWPDAQLIFLLRHPGAIARSRHETRPQDSIERNAKMVKRYGDALEAARQTYEGLTVRYEDVATDPAAETRRICEFLGIRWLPEMVNYGEYDHGRFTAGLGDWKDKIKSGQVQPPEPPPAELPKQLEALTVAWGYAKPTATTPAS
jgi:hypothetical protein